MTRQTSRSSAGIRSFGLRPAILVPLLPALALAAGVGCMGRDRLPAVGPGYEWVVLSPDSHRDLGRAVAEVLGTEVVLVRPEPTFQVEEDALAEWSYYKTRKLLFLAAPAGEPTLADAMRASRGTSVASGFPGLWIVREPYAAGQAMLVLTGEPDSLRAVLRDRRDDLLDVADNVATTLLVTNLYRAGEMPGARDRMLAAWGWGVRVPPGWTIDQRFAEDGFVRIWHDGPVEQLFVSWEPGRVDRSPDEWLLRRDVLTGLYYQGDLVTRDPAVTTAATGATPFGRDGVVLDGAWENEIYVIGGPFRSWAFWCPEDDRTYFLDVSAYAPDRDKGPLMRTLRAVARTFRCGCAPGGGASATADAAG